MGHIEKMLSPSLQSNIRRTRLPEPARWGWISPHAAERLASNSRLVAMVRLSPSPTVRSVGQSILELFEGPETLCLTRSGVWSRVYEHFSRSRFELVIFTCVKHLNFGRNRSRNAIQLRDALTTLLNQGVGIGFIGAQSEVQFLLYDWQLQSRCVGSLSFPGEQPA
jgi:hypothetical protein